MQLPSEVKERAEQWLKEPYDQETRTGVQALLDKDPAALIDAFYTTIAFGTGGMRGLMGLGTNRLNRYTIRFATQGLANYIHAEHVTHPRVYISYDSRHNSRFFAEETARVLAGNGIEVFITKEMRPTPYVSFGCRYRRCTAAVMITASHNPPEYNGYKVYWSDGGQVVPPHDIGIMAEVNKINHPSQVKIAAYDDSLIHKVNDDEAYFEALLSLQNKHELCHAEGKTLKILYSPLHGCGSTTLPEALNRWGFKNLSYIEAQRQPDGNFPAARSPNPESEAALKLGIEKLLKDEADLFIATDPDADRMGLVVRYGQKAIILNGNQIAALCLYYLCTTKVLSKNSAAITTIVTTELFKEIALSFNVACFEVLTGFKYIGEKIHEWEQNQAYTFLFGAEESLGFLYGTHARDKDATIAACLIAEIALTLKKEGKTLIDLLEKIYQAYGPFMEKQLSVDFGSGKEGMEKMTKLMTALRKNPPKHICEQPIVEIIDYLNGNTSLPRSDVLLFRLKDKSKFIIRPSGTEPKIKIYGLARYQDEQKLIDSLQSLKEYMK